MQKLMVIALLTAAVVCTSGAAAAGPDRTPSAGGTVWAVERFDLGTNTLAGFDARSGEVLGVVPIGRRPIGVTAPHGTAKVYTADERSNQLSVLSKDSFSIVKRIPMGAFPHHMMASPNGKLIYVGQYNTNTVGVVDTTLDVRIHDWPASNTKGAKTHAVWITRDGKDLYTTNEVANSVSKLDARSGRLIWEFPIGNRPSEVLVTPNGRTAYVTVRNDNRAKVLDVSGEIPVLIGDVFIGVQPDTMQMTNDGKTLVVGLRSIPQMSLMDTDTLKVRFVTFPEGYGISGHEWLSANGKLTYIGMENLDTAKPGAIGVIDNDSGNMVDMWTYPGGPWPHGVFYEPQVLR